MRYLKYLLFSVIILSVFTPFISRAQELEPDQVEIVRAKILDIQSQGSTTLPVLNISDTDKNITVESGKISQRHCTGNNIMSAKGKYCNNRKVRNKHYNRYKRRKQTQN